MNFKKINNLAGWLVFFIATAVYVMTAEKNGSLWDCGEFVACCFKLQIPHPPGAPLFVIIGRIFIILFGDNPATAAKAVNIMSALASSFTILFLFWSITHMARKLVNPIIETINGTQLVSIIGAGVVGALAYTFSDSFWYSAVEGEVYALSSFFTALVFWAILKWEQQVDKDSSINSTDSNHFNADKWVVFIFFMMGLSIGVHLLNLLTIPAIVMVYYFKRFKVTRNGTIFAFILGCIITGVVQKVVIQSSVNTAGSFDRMFVNSFNLPFFSGFAFFFILMAVIIAIGLRVAAKKKWYYVRLGLWSITFMFIGYSSYLTTMIRSSANPVVDMYNVDNPNSLVGYLGREQYGDFPLVYGQVFSARPIDMQEGAMKYQMSREKGKYIEIGKDFKYVYDDADMMFLPRMWDGSNDQGRADYYASFLGIGKVPESDKNFWSDLENQGHYPYERRANFRDNIQYFLGYQNYWMYLRYFMWNFAGKQNDVQGVDPLNIRDGNWITGISLVDNVMYGDQSALPDTLKENKAHNTLYALPFILGLLGFFYQYYKNRKDFIVTFLLFFFTGLAIVLYLNQAGNQPRERDYAYVGSFYAFAIWIGLAIPAIVGLATRSTEKKFMPKIAIGVAALMVLFAITAKAGNSDGAFVGLLILGALSIGVIYALVYGFGALKKEGIVSKAATVLGLAVVLLMAAQEWDDHDRSRKTTAPDLAVDYLESCEPNAMLFTFGDNDTYPLWYAQEVMGVRPDIRVVNYSLLGIDWYVNQLRYKVNESAPFDVIFSAEQLEGNKRSYVRLKPNGNQEEFRDIENTFRTWVASDESTKVEVRGDGSFTATYPTKRFSIPVDREKVFKNGTVNASDSLFVEPQINLEVGNALTLADLTVLSVIATNKWDRPIYFTSKFTTLGFGDYLRRDGMTYRLVPLKDDVNTEHSFKVMMEKFKFGSADVPGVYFDEENRRHLNSMRQAFADVALSLSGSGDKEKARQLLDKVDNGILQANMPYGMVSRYNQHNQSSLMLYQAALSADHTKLADKIATDVKKELTAEMNYFEKLSASQQEKMEYEMRSTRYLLDMLQKIESDYKKAKEVNVEQKKLTTKDSSN
ncbi:glycosyltransferase family 117 protein [Polluticaenibacter yanchengensis]|uniref:DUF2723 domain-containing protein n=1 Tax=Polluticaenibacter yanchengensis TaxID=3014562 RepID=A0ABT4UIL7_9BACT|nr:DUF2723 domain-containing protein [Chitinophagaceae bacterium LY-5]